MIRASLLFRSRNESTTFSCPVWHSVQSAVNSSGEKDLVKKRHCVSRSNRLKRVPPLFAWRTHIFPEGESVRPRVQGGHVKRDIVPGFVRQKPCSLRKPGGMAGWSLFGQSLCPALPYYSFPPMLLAHLLVIHRLTANTLLHCPILNLGSIRCQVYFANTTLIRPCSDFVIGSALGSCLLNWTSPPWFTVK